jgi:4-hydroxy-tetrahydrodipicolinate reductase
MTKIIITGSKGRMGQALIACAPQWPQNIEIVGTVDQGDDLAAVIGKCDVVIDFSSPEATEPNIQLCTNHNKALVIGTTGQPAGLKASLVQFPPRIPVVWSSNFSTGVNTLFWLTRMAAEIIGSSFDLEIIEMHHRLKKDAPSGTAKTLEEILRKVRKEQLGTQLQDSDIPAIHGREGIVGERKTTEIGVHSVRGGDVVGDHTVIFSSIGERLELTHKASDRKTFANGALRAAIWATMQEPGLYDMQDVLELNRLTSLIQEHWFEKAHSNKTL